MRIAISGTHFSGKSSLVSALVRAMPGYVGVEEAYFFLEDEGYLFSDPPVFEDYKELFIRSKELMEEKGKNTIFDRTPLDYLAYAMAVGKGREDFESWFEGWEMSADLVIFLPIEGRDRIPVPPSEDLRLRQRVDEELEELILDDSMGVLNTTQVLEVGGDLEKRVEKVLLALDIKKAP